MNAKKFFEKSLVLLEVHEHHHPQGMFFNLHFWDPHNLQLKNYIVTNEKFCPIEVKTEIF